MKPQETKANVAAVEPLTESIVQLFLKPEHFIEYNAGQYLQIQMDNEWLAYSIANAPVGAHKYELHIRHSLNNPMNQRLFAEIKAKGCFKLTLPFGACSLSYLDKNKPLIFIAGGTGFAPIKAMIEELLATGDQRPFELYWTARSQADLYMDTEVLQWQEQAPHFRYYSFYPESKNKENLASLVLDRVSYGLKPYQIIISGPFDMVYATSEILIAGGVRKEQLFSDAFSFISPGKP